MVLKAVSEEMSQLKVANEPETRLASRYEYSGRTCLCSVVLQAVLLGDVEVVIPALVLGHLDVPGPGGGGGGGGVDVQGDGHTGGAGRHPHVLPGVVATDDRRGGEPGNTDYEPSFVK